MAQNIRSHIIDLSSTTQITASNTSPNLVSFDFLRSFAVILVLVCHLMVFFNLASEYSAYLGRFGVLLFFVHTSFVLMLSLERHFCSMWTAFWVRFQVRRVFRIYPLSICVVLAIVIFRIPSRDIASGFTYLSLGPHDVLSNILLTMNLTYSQPILTPLWSLPYEIQMYLFLPVLFLIIRKCSKKCAIILFCLAIALALLQPLTPKAGRIDVMQFFPCFYAGAISYRIYTGNFRSHHLPFFFLPIVLTVLTILFIAAPTYDNGFFAWFSCLSIALFMPFVRSPQNAIVVFSSKIIAKYSYGIYLTHCFCIWVAFRVTPISLPLQFALFSILLSAIPFVLFNCIEKPCIDLGKQLSKYMLSERAA